jgi:hypothetical protein
VLQPKFVKLFVIFCDIYCFDPSIYICSSCKMILKNLIPLSMSLLISGVSGCV